MLTITDPDALRRAARDPTLPAAVRAVLALRLRQTGGEGAHLHVAQAGDGVAEAEAAVEYPLTLDGEPQWEWLEHHPGGVAEVCIILSDDGPAQVLIVPDTCPAIAELLREHAD